MTMWLSVQLFFAFFFFVFFVDVLLDFLAFFGTFLPARRASDNPIAIACLRLLTLRPERPLFKVPAFFFFIARPTFADAPLEYFRALRAMKMFSYDTTEIATITEGSRPKPGGRVTRLIRRAQPIADAGLGQHIVRTFGIGLDLLPELTHIDPQILRIGQLVPQFLQ